MHTLICILLAVSGALAIATAQRPGAGGLGAPPGPDGPRGGPPVMSERKLVARFDRDANRRLDAQERRAARAWLASQPPSGRFRPGSDGRPGPPPGAPVPAFAPTSPGPRVQPAHVQRYAKAALYDPPVVRTLFLEFDASDWEAELSDFHNSDVEVPARVTVDGQTLRDVGVRFRGLSSYLMIPAGSKRSLNLSLDAVREKQHLYGYRTLNLLNAHGDPSFVRAALYSEIARAYIPAPKVNYVRVVINGESWGLYVNAQQFNRDFVRDFFRTTAGARWKVPGRPFGRGGLEYLGETIEPHRAIYDLKTAEDEASWRALIRLCRVLDETPPAALEAALAPILDLEGVLAFLALEVALVNNDGYWARASDYNLYLDPRARFHLIPHDINEALLEETFPFPPGGLLGRPPPGSRDVPPGERRAPRAGGPPGSMPPFMRGTPDLDPLVGLDDPRKPLRSKLLAVPALRNRYLALVRDIATRWLDWQTLEPKVAAYRALIAEDVRRDTRKLYSLEEFQRSFSDAPDSLKTFVERRRAFLLQDRPRPSAARAR